LVFVYLKLAKANLGPSKLNVNALITVHKQI